METIALYWEPEIKTYGLFERTGLSMISYSLPVAGCGAENLNIRHTATYRKDLLLTFAHLTVSGSLRMHLIFDTPSPRCRMAASEAIGHNSRSCDIRVATEVELVYFNGPHFGDRYGIADAAFQSLSTRNIPILAAACASASVFIVLPKQTAQRARKALATFFSLPDGSAH